MKQLNEFLSAKIKNKSLFSGSFPESFDKKDLTDFLDCAGFEKILLNGNDTIGLDDIFTWAEEHKNPFYILCDYSTKNKTAFWLRIAKGGEITDTNPYFMMQIENGNYTWIGTETYTSAKNFTSKRQFFDQINKFFDW